MSILQQESGEGDGGAGHSVGRGVFQSKMNPFPELINSRNDA